MEPNEVLYNIPQQKRSRESLERLLAAAEERLSEVGIESFTIADVVGRADLSVGAFYARFPDKTALLRAVQDRFHNRLEPPLHEAMRTRGFAARDLAQAIDILVDLLVGHLIDTREVSRAFMMSSVFDPVMRARGERVNGERRQAFAEVLLIHRAEIGHADPMAAIEMAYGLYAAVVRGVLVFGIQHELHYDISNPIIVREIKRAIALYLVGDHGAFAFSSYTS